VERDQHLGRKERHGAALTVLGAQRIASGQARAKVVKTAAGNAGEAAGSENPVHRQAGKSKTRELRRAVYGSAVALRHPLRWIEPFSRTASLRDRPHTVLHGVFSDAP